MLRRRWQKNLPCIAKRAFAALTVIAVVCKLAIPTGFMPASLKSGAPFRLCHVGLPSGLGDHGAHTHHESDGPASDISYEHCSLGALGAAIAMPIPDWALPWRASGFVQSLTAQQPPSARGPLAVRSRGPPPFADSI